MELELLAAVGSGGIVSSTPSLEAREEREESLEYIVWVGAAMVVVVVTVEDGIEFERRD